MEGWLRDDCEMDQALTGRIVAGVRGRVARRRRNRMAVSSAFGLCLVGLLVGTWLADGHRPGTAGRQDEARHLQAPSPFPNASSPPLSLEKVDHSVAVTWEGNPQAEYFVYRCNSPRFDSCSLADRVRGTQWVDPEPDSSTITFYKVERRG